MKRDTFDFSVLGDVAQLREVPSSEALVQQAHANWLSSLRSNGNQPGRNHQDAGWQLLRAMVDQLYGVRTGRFAYAVPCGGGKTQAVVALLTSMFELRVFGRKTVLVVAQQVDALCNIKQKLLDAGLPEQVIGIFHSKTNAAYPSTGEEKRPIMLVTHARIQRDGFLRECCRNRHGVLHDLVIWDEALISTEAVVLAQDTTVTALGHFAVTGKCPTVAQAYERLHFAVKHEQADQRAGQAACELPPLITEEEADLIGCELQSVGYLDKTGLSLREQARNGASLIRNAFRLIDPLNGLSAGLMRYVVKVPDELSNIVILDASHAIDELRQADRTIRAGTTEAMLKFKEFSTVMAFHHPVASGRSAIKTDGKAILEAVRIAKGVPHDESVLFVTFKDGHARQLAQALRDAGLSVVIKRSDDEPEDREMPDGKPQRLTIITWGSHTSSNSHSHCKHVVLVGLLRLPLLLTASQLAAQKRDLTHRLDKTGLLSLERSVIAGEVMQAMNRGCMRLTDAEGQAHPMTVHIIAKDDLRPFLEQAMPGLCWETAAVGEPTRAEDAANRIVEYVLSLPESTIKVSKQSIFAAIGIEPSKDVRAGAMSKAMLMLAVKAISDPVNRWSLVAKSLQRHVLD